MNNWSSWVMKFSFFGTPNCYHSERHDPSPPLRCPTPAFLPEHSSLPPSLLWCMLWEAAAEGACLVSLPSAEILPSCQRQNVTLFSSSCGCEKCESQDFASAPGAAFRIGLALVDSKQEWRKVCVLVPEHVWEFALSSARLLEKITGPGKSYLCLMGCQWSLASQNYSSPSEKNTGQLWSTYPWSWDENNPVSSNSLSCGLCKFWPHRAGLGGVGAMRKGRTKGGLQTQGCCRS